MESLGRVLPLWAKEWLRNRFAGEAHATQWEGGSGQPDAQQQVGQGAPEIDPTSPILQAAGGGFETQGDPDAYAARQDFRPGVNQ